MPKIDLSPDLPDSFVRMDWNDSASDPKGFAETLVDHYEDGSIVVLKNSPIAADYELLNRIEFPAGDKFKKVGDHHFQWPRPRGYSLGLHSHLIRHHTRDYLAARAEIRRVSNVVREWTQQVFSGYQFGRMPCSWRFTPTGHESMHIDSFGALGHDPEKWYVRIFLNVDFEPRQWRVSRTLESLAETHYDSAELAQWRDGRGSDFSRELSKSVFGSRWEPEHEDEPYHGIAWETGDVWLVDSRMQSHQVISGRRMMATGFEVDPSSMRDPLKSLDHRVRGYHEKSLTAS